MSHKDDELFKGGRANPAIAGVPLRFRTSGEAPDEKRIVAAAEALVRPVRYVDPDGYEQEIIAAVSGPDGEIAYVTSSAKELSEYVDVSFKFRLRDRSGNEVATEITSYNPYFGCDVSFLEWMESSVVLIYREKHHTYISSCAPASIAQYKKISDYWRINAGRLGYWPYKGTEVSLLSLPALLDLPSISESQAITEGICPPKAW